MLRQQVFAEEYCSRSATMRSSHVGSLSVRCPIVSSAPGYTGPVLCTLSVTKPLQPRLITPNDARAGGRP